MSLKRLQIFFGVVGLVLSLPISSALAQECKFGKFEVLQNKACIDTLVQSRFVDTINTVIWWVLVVAVALGLITFVVGGYVYMTAGGNAQRVGTAKTVMGAALLGIALAIAAQLILNTISPQFGSDIRLPFR